MYRDMHNNIQQKVAISPVVVADNTAQVSAIIDRSGFGTLEFIIATGTLADPNATFTVLVEDGDAANLADAAAVDDKYLLGTEALASFDFSKDDAALRIGYAGYKRYVRLTITPGGNSADAPLAAVAILGAPKLAPVANP